MAPLLKVSPKPWLVEDVHRLRGESKRRCKKELGTFVVLAS